MKRQGRCCGEGRCFCFAGWIPRIGTSSLLSQQPGLHRELLLAKTFFFFDKTNNNPSFKRPLEDAVAAIEVHVCLEKSYATISEALLFSF